MPNLWKAFFSSRRNRAWLAGFCAALVVGSMVIGYSQLSALWKYNEVIVENLNLDFQTLDLAFATAKLSDGSVLVEGTAPSLAARDRALSITLSRILELQDVPWRTIQVEDNLKLAIGVPEDSVIRRIKAYSLAAPIYLKVEMIAVTILGMIIGSVFGHSLVNARMDDLRTQFFRKSSELAMEKEEIATERTELWRRKLLHAQRDFQTKRARSNEPSIAETTKPRPAPKRRK